MPSLTPLCPEPLTFTAAVTAGGQSRRFGTDKAAALLRGQPLLQHVTAPLQGCAVRLLVGRAGPPWLRGWTAVPDTRPGQGPLAGLEAALRAAPPGWVAFTGVDLPGLDGAFWAALAAAARPELACVRALDAGGRAQPLAALYHTRLAPRVTALLDAGERRLRLAAADTLDVPGLLPPLLRNVNTPADLAALNEGQ